VKRLDRILQRLRIAQAVPWARPGARVLDIGCAGGELYGCVPGVKQYVGVDPDAPEPFAANVRFVRDVFPTPAIDPAERFDLVTALAVLEHVPADVQPEFARACAHCLAPGGRLAITVPSAFVDVILAGLQRLRLVDGMHAEQHFGYDPGRTPDLFASPGLALLRRRRFELGLNHLFVFERCEQ